MSGCGLFEAHLATLAVILSTSSVGRATGGSANSRQAQKISIHALRGEGDANPAAHGHIRHYFYPRPPWGGRQVYDQQCNGQITFLSTPSVGRATTGSRFRSRSIRQYFYPRPPWGGRRCAGHMPRGWRVFLSTPSAGRATGCTTSSTARSLFLSTPSVGRATFQNQSNPDALKISIHALRGEGDVSTPNREPSASNFYPRPPWGGRPPRSSEQTPL